MAVFTIFSIVMLAVAILLFIFHFSMGISTFWFTIPLALGIISNLISAIIMIKKKKQEKQ